MARPRRRIRADACALAMVLVAAAASLAGAPDEAAFLAENEAAMRAMMAGMTIEPSGDIDRDFVAMMVPHHEGAIAMAQAELRYGSNEQLRRLAQEIIVGQSQEVQVMRLAIARPSEPSAGPRPIPDRPHAAEDRR